jgi:hypothetical protein
LFKELNSILKHDKELWLPWQTKEISSYKKEKRARA